MELKQKKYLFGGLNGVNTCCSLETPPSHATFPRPFFGVCLTFRIISAHWALVSLPRDDHLGAAQTSPCNRSAPPPRSWQSSMTVCASFVDAASAASHFGFLTFGDFSTWTTRTVNQRPALEDGSHLRLVPYRYKVCDGVRKWTFSLFFTSMDMKVSL